MVLASNEPAFLEELMRTGRYSDLTFTCRGVEFRVRRFQICPMSAVIESAIASQNSSPPVITMDSFRLDEVNRFVQFLYTGTYNEPDTEDEDSTQNSQEEQVIPIATQSIPSSEHISPDAAVFEASVLGHVRMNAIAHHHAVQSLVQYANYKVGELLVSVHVDHLPRLPRIIEEARHLTEDTDVRDLIVKTVATNIKDLVSMEGFQKLSMMSPFPLQLLEEVANTNDLLAEKVKILLAEVMNARKEHKVKVETDNAAIESHMHQLREHYKKKRNDIQVQHQGETEVLKSRIALLESQKNSSLDAERSRPRLELDELRARHAAELHNARNCNNSSSELQTMKQRLSKYEETVDLLLDTDQCRNVSCLDQDGFGCKVDIPHPDVSRHPFILRCLACRCKHPYE